MRSFGFLRFVRAGVTGTFALLAALSLSRCAESECSFNSECTGRGLCVEGRCKVECLASVDCPADRPICSGGVCSAGDGGVVTDSSSPDASIDTGTPPPDTGAPPPDTGTPPTDTGTEWPDTSVVPDTTPPPDTSTGGTKGYLTKCTSGAECASGVCSPDVPSFCTKSCSSHAECANGQICAAGTCRLDDTGKTGCDLATASPCGEFCYGTPTSRHCTHACTSASQCPAGYACMPAGAGKKVCVEIEKPCGVPEQCPSGLGFCGAGGVGCTARCDTAADCPHRLVGLPPYTCELVSGQKVCVAPADVLGSDPLGATCSGVGTNTCRSGACDDGTSPPSCAQRCTTRGGCPVGRGCFPLEDSGSALLVCSTAGGAWLGDACTRGRDCLTAICQSPGYCSRLCDDGYCPDGMTCVAAPLTATDGTPIKLCTK